MHVTEEMAVMGFFFVIAAGCLIAVAVFAVKERRRSGWWPYELTHVGNCPAGAFYWILMGRIVLIGFVPNRIVASVPAALVLGGIDLCMAVAGVAMAVLAIAASFKPDWNKHWSYRQTALLMFAVICCVWVGWDIQLYRSESWIWIIAGLEATFLSPLMVRLAYKEFYIRMMEPPAEPEKQSELILPPF